MLEAARKYAQRVVLVHLALLLVVIAFLAMGARSLYIKAREQQIASTNEKQQMLARQTARGIEAYYRSITQDLELILRPEATADPTTRPVEPPAIPAATATPNGSITPAAPNAQPSPGTPEGGPRGNPGAFAGGGPNQAGGNFGGGRNGRGGIRNLSPYELRTIPASDSLLKIMAQQLHGRVSDLFIVEGTTVTDAQTAETHKVAKINFCFPENDRGEMTRVADRNLEWITGLTDTEMSDFITLDNGHRVHLIGVPARRMEQVPGERTIRMAPCTVVAVVPIANIKDHFFNSLNDEGLSNAALLDSQGTIMIAKEPQLIGQNVLSMVSADANDMATHFITENVNGTAVVRVATTFHGVTFEPRIMAFEQVNKEFDRPAATNPAAAAREGRWIVIIGSPLASTEALVKNVFESALYWGIFVAVSMIGLFFSSSFFLIRSRIRFERQKGDILTRELNQARDIQLAWLPKAEVTPTGLDIAAINLPASHISGDFYNWFTLPDGRIAVAIGDVTGHGMSAAFLMSTTQLLVRTTLLRVKDAGQCLEEVNRQLCSQSFSGQFVTMLLMVLDPEQCTVEIAAAGHPAPLVANRSAFRPLEIETQLVLGVELGTKYPTQSYVLHPGSTILMYTDGVVEAESPEGTLYQTKRLLASVSRDFPSARAILDAVVEDVKTFTGTGELMDDLTMVALQLLPVPNSINQPQAIATKL